MAESPSPQPSESGSGRDHAELGSWFGQVTEEVDELVGSVLSGSYLVERVLGEGAMGRVYEASHTRLAGKRFAVKVLHADLMRHKQIHVRFAREAEAMSLLDHRNIVGVFDVDQTPDGRPFMVCEYLEGEELGAYVERVGKLPLGVAAHVARQLCVALSAAHASGVTHRDMKPENVFLMGEDRTRPRVKVLDFGLARLEASIGDSLTQAGTVMGTPAYMAPEQARGLRVDHRADVYAVGAILYHLLTGKKPFEHEDARATLAAVLTQEPPRPRSIEPSISEEVEVVIQRAMAREQAERYQTADELERALAALVTEKAPAPALVTLPPPRAELSTLSTVTPYSRATLLVVAILTLVWTVGLLVSGSVSALELVTGRGPGESLSTAELALLLATVCAVVATPSILYLRYLRGRLWNNSMRVSREAASLRAVLLATMAAYGGAALVVRLVDVVLSRVFSMPLAHRASSAWQGWPIVFVLVCAVVAAAVTLSRRLSGQEATTRTRRIVAGPVLAAAVALLTAAIMYAGFTVRGVELEPARDGDDTSASAAPRQPTPGSPAAASGTVAPAASATSTDAPVARAPAVELTRALRGGAPALEALAKKYPGDVAVMKALVELYAKEPSSHLMALEWTRRLLDAQPEAHGDSMIKQLVLRAAQGDEPTSSRALDLIASEMGSDGPDLLYDLMVAGKQGVREHAEKMLARADVRAKATPAVAIAYDLRTAETCAALLELLERAAQDGDARTLSVLSYAVEGAKRGCGPRRTSPCPAKCGDKIYQDRARATIAKIETRLGRR